MNKVELIDAVATETGLNKTQAKLAVEATLKNIASGVRKNKKATFVGFGTFKAEIRAERTGRNPQTGQAMQIPAKEVIKFKASF
jgi:nucleoid DNA-binding protein